MPPRPHVARASAPARELPQIDGEAKLAEAVHAAIERFGPAADVVAGCGDRLDKLCQWLKSHRPWLFLAGFMLLSRTVNSAPEDFPNLIKSAAEVVRALK